MADDLDTATRAAAVRRYPGAGGTNNPDIRAAQATVHAADVRDHVERARRLYPSLSFDYFYGMNANQFAMHNREGLQPCSARWRRRS